MPDTKITKAKDLPVKKVLPIIPLRNLVLFPSVESSLFFGRKSSRNALLHAYNKTNRLVIVTAQKKASTEKPDLSHIYTVGCLARIEHIIQSDGNLHAVVRGLSRVNIIKLVLQKPYLTAEFIDLPIITESKQQIEQAAEALMRQLKKAFAMGRRFDLPAIMQLSSGVSSNELADQVCFSVEAKMSEKQKMLETLLVSKRLELATQFLNQEIKVAQLERNIEKKTQKKFNSGMKRNILEERKRQIERELEKLGGNKKGKKNGLKARIDRTKMPKKTKKKILSEYKRLKQMNPMSPEYGYISTYLETVLDLPWGKHDQSNIDIKKSKKILDSDHYGLSEVKERMLEFLAVYQLRSKNKSTDQKQTNILCFIGPPGVGKTSLGKSIAKALDRKFVRASLGGVKDEAEIRGHRRTYVGAMTGRIIKSIKDSGSMNPVFMLDEVDKIGSDYRGDPSAALLEALDPEQNDSFEDHYLDFPIDLSDVFFILTGNQINTIPGPLRDRLEIINFSGYTQKEKFHIAKNYLVKKQLNANGLTKKNIVAIKDDTLKYLIDKYTREAGVRELERVIARLFRKVAKTIVSTKKTKVNLNDKKTLSKFMGPEKFSSQLKGKKDQVGTSTGLAYTTVGGDILFIEVNIMPGKGKLILTGKLGRVMKESARASLSFVRSQSKKYGIKQDFDKIDIHIHVPEGGTPKDGPSAGSAITTALISALTGKAVPKDIGMTGEITLRGNVLEIGGLKEKSLAAHRAGLNTIFFPQDNKKNLVDIPSEVKKDIKFIPVDHYSAVYKHIFG